jgi:hypothetical protein
MNDEHALAVVSFVIGAILLVGNALAGGSAGTGETIGVALMLFGIRTWRARYQLPRARLVRSR